MTLNLPSSKEAPKPDEVHYSAWTTSEQYKITKAAAEYWLRVAHEAMLFELSEEINSGQRQVGSNWWRAQVHRRALELIDADDELRPAYQTRLHQEIEDNALFHYAGYNSAEEWFASEASLKKGGMHYELKWIASVLIPWCKANGVFKSDEIADNWFFTVKNSNGESRIRRLRDALPELRRVIVEDLPQGYKLDEQQRRLITANILKEVSGNLPGDKFKEDINEIRGVKPVIRLHRNGDGRWHGELHLDDHQLDRFKLQNQFTTVIIFEEPLRGDYDDWWLEGLEE